MRRTLFILCSAVSLLLFLAACVGWVTSYSHPQFVYYEYLVHGPPVEIRTIQWMSDNGATSVTADRTIADVQSLADKWLTDHRPRGFRKMAFIRRPLTHSLTDGFHYRWLHKQETPISLTVEARWIGAPYWFCVLASSLLPLTWAVRHRYWRMAERRRKGRCPACGYDLRATPGRCPECGAIADKISS